MNERQTMITEIASLSNSQVFEGLRFNGERSDLPGYVGVSHANLACMYKNEALKRGIV